MVDFLVHRDDPRVHRTEPGETARAGVSEGTVQFTVERFGLTANNLTYAVFADRWGYWDFFPAPPGWGRVPVWGFGRVHASGVAGLAAGERFYGYWPMSSRVTMQVDAGRGGFVASSPERAALPGVYNRYLRAVPETGFPPEHDDAAAVLRPLFLTGWLIADRLAADGWLGAGSVVLASASSKTAYCTASVIRQHDDRPALVGLTSAARVAFVAGLGLYDEVLAYEEVGAVPTDRPMVLVDMAGDAEVRSAVHRVAGDALRASLMVGATHWEGASLDAGGGLPGPEPELFFAPTVAEERALALGPAAFARQVGAAWAAFAARAPELVEFEHATGADALARAFTAFLDGAVDPRRALVFSL